MNSYGVLTVIEIRNIVEALPKRSRVGKRLAKMLEELDPEITELKLIGPDEEELHGDPEDPEWDEVEASVGFVVET